MDKHMEMSRLYFTLCGLHFFVHDVFFNFLSKLKYLGYAHQYLDKSEPDLFRFQLQKFYHVYDSAQLKNTFSGLLCIR